MTSFGTKDTLQEYCNKSKYAKVNKILLKACDSIDESKNRLILQENRISKSEDTPD